MNAFFEFVQKYRDDIVAFFNAFIELLKTLIEKANADDAEETTAAV